jgi:hypothetical protein
LLVKLALLERAGADPRELLLAQRWQLAPIASAPDDRLRSAEGCERTLALWRCEAMAVTMRFLAVVTARQLLAQARAPRSRPVHCAGCGWCCREDADAAERERGLDRFAGSHAEPFEVAVQDQGGDGRVAGEADAGQWSGRQDLADRCGEAGAAGRGGHGGAE